MSTLSNLLRQVEAADPQLAADLRREVEALSARRAFGLNFERHIPETVDGSLNRWEIEVLDKEMCRPDFQAWYRNPSRPSDDALAIAYQDAQGHWRRMCPDFLFFHGKDDDVKVSIIDPHGHHLGDALPKLPGLAEFAAAHGAAFHRIESVARMGDGTLRVLDLTEEPVRASIRDAENVEALYSGGAGADY